MNDFWFEFLADLVKFREYGKVLLFLPYHLVHFDIHLVHFFVMKIAAHHHQFKFGVRSRFKTFHQFDQSSFLAASREGVYKKKNFHLCLFIFKLYSLTYDIDESFACGGKIVMLPDISCKMELTQRGYLIL